MPAAVRPDAVVGASVEVHEAQKRVDALTGDLGSEPEATGVQPEVVGAAEVVVEHAVLADDAYAVTPTMLTSEKKVLSSATEVTVRQRRNVKQYGQFCSVARALDVLGDRWAMLAVRELLLGPKRYTDLRDGLPGVGTNVLAVRLRELEDSGIIAREKLPPPAPATVYALTDDGLALRPVVDELARWGLRFMDRPKRDDEMRSGWLAYSLAISTPPSGMRDGDELELRVDDEPYTLLVRDGRFEAREGAAASPIAAIDAQPASLFQLATGQARRRELEAGGNIAVHGHTRAARRFLDAANAAWLEPAAR
jgi:DNA-binding HxlR family transcriptional regulator